MSARYLGARQIAKQTGLWPSTITRLLRLRPAKMRRSVVEKVLALDAAIPAPGQRIPSAKAWRQIKWLLAEGFTLAEIARRIGAATIRRRPLITAARAARIARLFRAMHE
jgi:transcriptional regulator with XRE-family HTH domain